MPLKDRCFSPMFHAIIIRVEGISPKQRKCRIYENGKKSSIGTWEVLECNFKGKIWGTYMSDLYGPSTSRPR